MPWQLQEAKQRFSEVVRRARSEGPQVVTRHGVPEVAVISIEQLHAMQGTKDNLKAFLESSPDFDLLELQRSSAPPRELDL